MKKILTLTAAVLTIASFAQASQKITGYGFGEASSMPGAEVNMCSTDAVKDAVEDARKNCVEKYQLSEAQCSAAQIVDLQFTKPHYGIDIMTCSVTATIEVE
jgi:hypothetical protein